MHPALAALAVAVMPTPAVPPAPTIPPAVLDDSLEIMGDSVAASIVETRMFVAVTVNDQGPFRFIVDSGADRSVIGMGVARRLGLPAGPSVLLNGMAGASRVATVRLDRLAIGASMVPGIVAPALPEAYIGAQGLIGIDALADQRLLLDFEARTITVEDARRPPPAADGEIVVTARRRKGQLILTQVLVDGRPIYAVIDTGSQVTIGNTALLSRVAKAGNAGAGATVNLISVTGQAIMAVEHLMPDVAIGGVRLTNVPVAFTDAPPFALFGLDKQPALLLGTDLLGTFRRVGLDFHNRKVRFTLPR